jgi:hypothetical protein
MKNFGVIKNTFSDILVEGIIRKDDKLKSLFKKFLKTVKENKILKAQFSIYKNLETRQDTDFNKAILYVNENINLLKKIGTDEIIKANQELLKLSEGVDVKHGVYDESLKNLHENITTLIFTKKSPDTIDEMVDVASKVAIHITENKKIKTPISEDLIPNSVLTSLYLSKFNEKYPDLSESEKEIIRVSLLNSNEQKEIYSKAINECNTLIENKLIEVSKEEAKETLLKVKDKLTNLVYNAESFATDYTKLVELKNDLK